MRALIWAAMFVPMVLRLLLAVVAAASRFTPLTVTAVTDRLQLLGLLVIVNVARARTSADPAVPELKNFVGKRA